MLRWNYGLCMPSRLTGSTLFGVKNLRVEIDASYIKGMLNNPDIQSCSVVNRCIIRISSSSSSWSCARIPSPGPDGCHIRKLLQMTQWKKMMQMTGLIKLWALQSSWWISRLLGQKDEFIILLTHLYCLTHSLHIVQKPALNTLLTLTFPIIFLVSELAQLTYDHLDSVRNIFSTPVTYNLLESSVCSLVQYASSSSWWMETYALRSPRLQQGCHFKKTNTSPHSPEHIPRAIFSMFPILGRDSGGPCWGRCEVVCFYMSSMPNSPNLSYYLPPTIPHIPLFRQVLLQLYHGVYTSFPTWRHKSGDAWK